MQITKIEVEQLEVPLLLPFRLSKFMGTTSTTYPIVVRVEVEDGLVGLGEADPHLPFTDGDPTMVFHVLAKILAPALIGQDPTNLAQIHALMDGKIRANSLAKAAIDMACYDLIGKYAGLPATTLCGGAKREEIPSMWAIGNLPIDESLARALKAQQDGYQTLMVKVGAIPLTQEVARLEALRSSLGADYRLIVDANQGWDFDTALSFTQQAAHLNIDLLEQPLRYDDITGLRQLRRRSSIPISADESLFTLGDAQRLFDAEAVDAVSIKIAKHGGIYRTVEIMELAAAAGIPCLMNSMLEEGITQAASLVAGLCGSYLYSGGHAYRSPRRLAADISSYSDYLYQGTIHAPPGPGLGIELKEDVVAKHRSHKVVIEKEQQAD